MKKLTTVFFVVTFLVVALITPAQAHEDDSEKPDDMCPAIPIVDPDAPSQFEALEVHEIRPEDPEHALLHEALRVYAGLQDDLCMRGLCMVGIDTGGPGYCHEDKRYLCKVCDRWETSGVEPFCSKPRLKVCVHKAHCDSWD